MKITPLFDRVVVKATEVEETTAAGIILPGSAKEKPQIFEVVAVGPGGEIEGKSTTMVSQVGDRVIISKYAGTEIKIDGVEYNIVRQGDILAKVG